MATKALKAVTVEDELNARDKTRENNLRIWNALSKTDPAHTSGFKRAGGFSGTAVKPIWVTQRLTELFGPCGVGWGSERPEFQLVTAGDDILVYCTVTAWYLDGGKQHFIYGIGGDVVRGKNKYGFYSDDEAYKKAFTDALGNAFKFIGVAADVHMGLFDDSKYVDARRKEFDPPKEDPPKRVQLDGVYKSKSALWAAVRQFVHTLNGIDDLGEFEGFLQTDEVVELLDQCKQDAPQLLDTGEGMPDEYEPLLPLIKRMRRELGDKEAVA